MGRLGRESHMAMCCKVLFLLVLVAEQGMGSPFIRIPPGIADMFTPAINLLQDVAVVTPGVGTGGATAGTGGATAGGGGIATGGGAIGTTGGGAVVVPGTAAMTM